MAKLTGVAPILLVKDIVASAEYFRDCIGFEFDLYNEPPTFAICSRDEIRIMLTSCDNPPDPHWKVVDKMWNAYFWVDNADELYLELTANCAQIDYSIYTTPWGIREFGIQDLDDHDIAFGQIL
ncbi:MAG: bleomycin resistance protein [Armatimonadota bacterium]|nr:bleomycin resistance protein [Armatimonadota bacterium]